MENGGIVYVGGETDSQFHALDVQSGRELWNFDVSGGVHTTPAIDNGTLFLVEAGIAGTSQNRLNALEATTGRRLWTTPLGFYAEYHPVTVAEGAVYIGDFGNVRALDAVSGATRWSFEEPGENTAVSVANGLIYFLNRNRNEVFELIAVEAASGKERWRFQALQWPDGVILDNKTIPTVAGGVVLFHTATNLFCVDAASGQELWRLPFVSIVDQPIEISSAVSAQWVVSESALGGQGVVFVADKSTLRALALRSGEELWNVSMQDWFSISKEATAGAPSVAQRRLYITRDHDLLVLNEDNGVTMQQFRTKGLITTSPVVARGRIFLGTDEGFLYSLGEVQAGD